MASRAYTIDLVQYLMRKGLTRGEAERMLRDAGKQTACDCPGNGHDPLTCVTTEGLCRASKYGGYQICGEPLPCGEHKRYAVMDPPTVELGGERYVEMGTGPSGHPMVVPLDKWRSETARMLSGQAEQKPEGPPGDTDNAGTTESSADDTDGPA